MRELPGNRFKLLLPKAWFLLEPDFRFPNNGEVGGDKESVVSGPDEVLLTYCCCKSKAC